MKLNALTLLFVTGIAPSLSIAGGSDTNSGLLRGLQQHNHDLAGRSAEVEAEFARDVAMPSLSLGRDLASGEKCTASEMCAFIANEIDVMPNPYMPRYPPGTPDDQKACLLQVITEKGCHAKVSDTSSMPVGEPYGPEEITHVICNACNFSEGEVETELSYGVEDGFTFCFTLGGGVEWQTPPVVGPKWSVNASGQWCWDSKTVLTVTSKIKCKPGTKVKAVAYKTMQPHKMILTKEWFQRVKFEWNKHPCAGPARPGFPHYVEHTCSSETDETTDTSEIYEVIFEDMTCPGTEPPTPSPPDCPITPGQYVTQEVSKNETHIENIIFEDPLYQFCPPAPTTSTSTSATSTSATNIMSTGTTGTSTSATGTSATDIASTSISGITSTSTSATGTSATSITSTSTSATSTSATNIMSTGTTGTSTLATGTSATDIASTSISGITSTSTLATSTSITDITSTSFSYDFFV